MANSLGNINRDEKKLQFGLYKRIIIFQSVIIIVILLAIGYYYYQSNQYEKLTQENANDILSEIAIIPDEVPSVAVIEEIDSLREKNVNLYKNAQNGDKLIVYGEKVIIYRDSERKIINMTLLGIK